MGAVSLEAVRRASLLALACVALWTSVTAYRLRHPTLTVTVLDVGQGDCIFVRAPNGRTMLIDGGSKSFGKDSGMEVARQRILPFLYQQGISMIDLLVLTHPHDDHLNGLPFVLKELKVGMVLEPNLLVGGASSAARQAGQDDPPKLDVDSDSLSYSEFERVLRYQKIKVMRAKQGQVIHLDPVHGVVGFVLAPLEPPVCGSRSDLNNNSVVIKLVHGRVSILLTGDIEEEAERRLLELWNVGLRAEILKVPHHGSETSCDREFLEAVQPQVAIISVGKPFGRENLFGHPSPKTLQKLMQVGAKVFRTDEDGAVRITSDGKTATVTPFVSNRPLQVGIKVGGER